MTALTRKHSFHEVFDSQRVYRLLLTAISNPPRTVNIGQFADKLFGKHPAMLALAFTLLDNEVSFSVLGDGALADEIAFLTLAKKARAECADYLFVTEPSLLGPAITAAKCGTLHDPHKSATLIVHNGGETISRLRLAGPGIDGTAELAATDTVKAAIELRDAQTYEYPQGIDFVFVSEEGELSALPRLVGKEAF